MIIGTPLYVSTSSRPYKGGLMLERRIEFLRLKIKQADTELERELFKKQLQSAWKALLTANGGAQ